MQIWVKILLQSFNLSSMVITLENFWQLWTEWPNKNKDRAWEINLLTLVVDAAVSLSDIESGF